MVVLKAEIIRVDPEVISYEYIAAITAFELFFPDL